MSEIPDKCSCGKKLVSELRFKDGEFWNSIYPCEACLENARADVRVEKSKEMIAFCESLKKENQV